jgi:hypothetical protein
MNDEVKKLVTSSFILHRSFHGDVYAYGNFIDDLQRLHDVRMVLPFEESVAEDGAAVDCGGSELGDCVF